MDAQRYTYAGGDPVNMVDPTGRMPTSGGYSFYAFLGYDDWLGPSRYADQLEALTDTGRGIADMLPDPARAYRRMMGSEILSRTAAWFGVDAVKFYLFFEKERRDAANEPPAAPVPLSARAAFASRGTSDQSRADAAEPEVELPEVVVVTRSQLDRLVDFVNSSPSESYPRSLGPFTQMRTPEEVVRGVLKASGRMAKGIYHGVQIARAPLTFVVSMIALAAITPALVVSAPVSATFLALLYVGSAALAAGMAAYSIDALVSQNRRRTNSPRRSRRRFGYGGPLSAHAVRCRKHMSRTERRCHAILAQAT